MFRVVWQREEASNPNVVAYRYLGHWIKILLGAMMAGLSMFFFFLSVYLATDKNGDPIGAVITGGLGLMLGLFAVVIVLLRRGFRIEKRRWTSWWEIFGKRFSTTREMQLYTLVRQCLELDRGPKGGRSLVYRVYLEQRDGRRDQILTTNDELQANEMACVISDFTGLKLVTNSLDDSL
jgi:hypothetical protein